MIIRTLFGVTEQFELNLTMKLCHKWYLIFLMKGSLFSLLSFGAINPLTIRKQKVGKKIKIKNEKSRYKQFTRSRLAAILPHLVLIRIFRVPLSLLVETSALRAEIH